MTPMGERGPAQVIDGNELAEAARSAVRRRVAQLTAAGLTVGLDAILVDHGDNAARVYAERQAAGCEALGIRYRLHGMDGSCGQADVLERIASLNRDPAVTAVMLHMPLPEGVDADAVKAAIDPAKDVEGVSPANIGNVIYGRSSLVPCTALAALRMIESTGHELRGARVVVLGASATVGRPLAAVLMAREATVISCNRWSWGLEELCRTADVLVCAVGRPALVTADMVKPGAVVIDVGINRIKDEQGRPRTVGDVAFEQVRQIAGWISPVPGGVGPMTVAMLLTNVVDAAAPSTEPTAAPGQSNPTTRV